jgi:hypothetical protein
MRNTRFIFVEGIMGSGKTTTAWFLTEYLQQHQIPARFLLEGPSIEEPDHPLRVAPTLPHLKEVWLDVTIEQYIELSLRKWHAFAHDAQQSATVTVCDGLLFHGNMTDLMLMNAEPVVLYDYVTQVIESIHNLNPVVVYYYHTDVAQALRTIRDKRGSRWEAYQVNWKLASPYAVQRSLQAFDGLVQLYQAYRALCDEFFAQLTLLKLAILNEGNWPRYYDEILTFLQLPPTSSEP